MVYLRTSLIVCLIISSALLFSGCETLSALGTGKIQSQDLAYLSSATTTFHDISGVEDDRSPEEQYNLLPPPWSQGIYKQLASTDSWLEKNLW